VLSTHTELVNEGSVAQRLIAAFLNGRSPNTLRAYSRDLEDFRAFLELAAVGDAVDELLRREAGAANELVLRYRAHMLEKTSQATEKPLQATTINRRLAAIRSIVKLARMLGMVNWNIEIEGLDVQPYRDTRGPGEDKIKKMINALKERTDSKGVRDAALVRLLHDVAFRRGEVVSLHLEHLDLEEGIVWVFGKGRHARERVTLPEKTKDALRAWLVVRGNEPGPLFIALDRNSYGHALTGSAVYAIIKNLGKKADVGKVRPHGLRHTAITTALDETNGNTRKVQKFSRHADGRTLSIYDDARQDFAGEIADLVSRKV